MTDMNKDLLKLGLTRNEISVYLALLNLRSATVSDITRKSGVHRRNVYDALERLEKRGLICHEVMSRAKRFRATNPYNLLQGIEDDKNDLRNKEQLATDIAESLQKTFCQSNEQKTNVTIRKGVKGVRTVLEDILITGKENRVLGAHRPPEIIESYLKNFHSRRIKLGIKDMLIFNNDFTRARELSKLPHTKVKLMPKPVRKSTTVNIYGDKVAILSWSEPVSILIENKDIANNFKQFFDFFWKLLK